jgi:transposase
VLKKVARRPEQVLARSVTRWPPPFAWRAAMMGAQTSAAAAREDLEALVPPEHLLRRVDRALDLAGVRGELAACYSRIGRPSVDPEVLLRLLLVGYLYGITSERRLVEEVRVNIAYRWFAGLPLRARVPHHSTFSKNRHGRFGAGVFRTVFEVVVRRCIAAGLVGGDACSVDGSMIDADASPQRHREPAAGCRRGFRRGPVPTRGAAGQGVADRPGGRVGEQGRDCPLRVLRQLPGRQPARRDRRRRGHAGALQRRGRGRARDDPPGPGGARSAGEGVRR